MHSTCFVIGHDMTLKVPEFHIIGPVTIHRELVVWCGDAYQDHITPQAIPAVYAIGVVVSGKALPALT